MNRVGCGIMKQAAKDVELGSQIHSLCELNS